MTTGMNGFSENGEWDFAAGSVYGYRSWTLEMSNPSPELDQSTFKLTGNWGGNWTSGTQQAECKYSRNSDFLNAAGLARSIPVLHENGDVIIPDEKCGCGFWAYWESPSVAWYIYPHRQLSDEYLSLETGKANYSDEEWVRALNAAWYRCPILAVEIPVEGIIQGFGRTIIGEKGFRCEKAIIKNLILVDDNPLVLPRIGGTNQQEKIRAEIEKLTGISLRVLAAHGLTQAGIDIPLFDSREELNSAYESYKGV